MPCIIQDISILVARLCYQDTYYENFQENLYYITKFALPIDFLILCYILQESFGKFVLHILELLRFFYHKGYML